MMLCKGRLQTEISDFQAAFLYGSRLIQVSVKLFCSLCRLQKERGWCLVVTLPNIENFACEEGG